MRTRILRSIGLAGTVVFAAALLAMTSGCAKEKEPTPADVTGSNAPKLDPNFVRSKMAEGMSKMAAAGGPKKIDPNH